VPGRDGNEIARRPRLSQLAAHRVEGSDPLLSLAGRLRLPADSRGQPTDDEGDHEHHAEREDVLRVRHGEGEVRWDYAGFPRLASLLSQDRFAPRQFGAQGDRLVFSNGILVLSGFAILLIVLFEGDTHALLPLYAIGLFLSFTLSQGGMVRHWLTLRGRGWRMVLNGTGAAATAVVLLTLTVTKFREGAWIVVVVIPLIVGAFLLVHRHYEEVAAELSLAGMEERHEFQHTVLILIGDVHRGVVRAVQYAKTLAPTAVVRGIYVETDPARTLRIEEKWASQGFGIPLVVLTSPYRSLLRPFLDYLDQIQSHGEEQMVTVVLPEFLPRRWWQHALHNQTALLIKGALLFRKNTVVADVPYLLKR
jgi:hypothetical protein